jgi:hypothetical protein
MSPLREMESAASRPAALRSDRRRAEAAASGAVRRR